MEKLNLTPQKHTFTNQKKCTTTQKTKASYDMRPGNGVGLFLFQRFIHLPITYLLRHLLTAPDAHGGHITKWPGKRNKVSNMRTTGLWSDGLVTRVAGERKYAFVDDYSPMNENESVAFTTN